MIFHFLFTLLQRHAHVLNFAQQLETNAGLEFMLEGNWSSADTPDTAQDAH